MWQLRAASLLGVLLLASVEAAVADPRRVMLLHSFSRNYAPWSLIAARLQEHLTKDSPHAFDIYEASLATERLGPSYDAQPFLQYLRTVFAGRDPESRRSDHRPSRKGLAHALERDDPSCLRRRAHAAMLRGPAPVARERSTASSGS